jgi:hypothetical protein
MDQLREAADGQLDAVAAMTCGLPAEIAVAMETRYKVECIGPDGVLKWIARAKNRVVTAGLNKLLDATFKTGLTTPLWYVGLVGASVSDAAITSGAAALTSASNAWVAADASRAIIVRGAGVSGADLVTTILTYSSAGAVTLNANAGTTVTGAKSAWDARAADVANSHSPWVEVAAYSNANRPTWTPGTVAAGSVDNSGSVAAFTINANTTDVFGAFLIDNNTISGTTGTLYGMAVFASPGSRRANSGDTINVTATLSASAV